MKKTIKYKNYDTSTAKLIGKMTKFSPRKAMNFNKFLYKTKKGQYFIYQFHEDTMRWRKFGFKKIFEQFYLVESDDIVKWLEDDFKDFKKEEYDKIVEEVKGVLAIG